jgi:phosphate-selective porin OprO/OprP
LAKVPAAPPTAIVKMSPSFRPSICSPDGLNCIALTSRLHFDVGGYDYRPSSTFFPGQAASTTPLHLDDGVNARRARIGVLGTFQGDWNYALVYDFGNSADGFGTTASCTAALAATCKIGVLSGGFLSGIENAYLSYQGFKGQGWNLAIEGGYMDTLYTLDEATSSNDIMFMERASPGVIAANIAAGDFRSTFGARWWGDWFWAGAYVTGPQSGAVHNANNVTTTAPDGVSEQLGGFARAAVHWGDTKVWSIHVGGAAEALFKPTLDRVTNVESLTLSDRPELRIDPTSILTTGAIANTSGARVYNVEAAGNWGSVFFQGEYFWYNVERFPITTAASGVTGPNLKFQGGYAQVGWVITGETRTYNAAAAAYNGIIPNNPWSWQNCTWGAWEIAARYSSVDLNDRLGFADGIAGGRQQIVTVGLNWYVNRNVRFMFDYLHGKVDKMNGPGVKLSDFQDVGMHFDAVATRMQVAF